MGTAFPLAPHPPFRFPLFYILHTCSVSEAHFVIWNIWGSLLWRRPALLLPVLPVFISHWCSRPGVRRALARPRNARAAQQKPWDSVNWQRGPGGSQYGSDHGDMKPRFHACTHASTDFFLFNYFKKSLNFYVSWKDNVPQRRYILMKMNAALSWGSPMVWLLSSRNISVFLAKWESTWIDLF